MVKFILSCLKTVLVAAAIVLIFAVILLFVMAAMELFVRYLTQCLVVIGIGILLATSYEIVKAHENEEL